MFNAVIKNSILLSASPQTDMCSQK